MKLHNPNITSAVLKENVVGIDYESLCLINQNDITFVAVGNAAVEKHIFDMIVSSSIKTPAVFVWCEPFCLSAHAVIVNNTKEIFNILFNSNYEFSYSVVSNSSNLFKRLSGCQSTFVPYSAYLIKRFIGEVLYQLLISKSLYDDNYLLSWFGEIHKAKEYGATINDEYIDAVPFSFSVKRVS